MNLPPLGLAPNLVDDTILDRLRAGQQIATEGATRCKQESSKYSRLSKAEKAVTGVQQRFPLSPIE